MTSPTELPEPTGPALSGSAPAGRTLARPAPTGPAPTGPAPTGPAPAGPEPLPGTDTAQTLRPRVTCRRCHRPLHDPESRMLRLGPECRDPSERVARFDVDQEPLPGVG
ncbi:DUF6011 domain-containing protein [Kitasatospora sp. NPDC004799]|uniref:DUF6011 domain-containing protein n=1 Tax=Kitasatospora sp. NPDC004799 TaxID=3154460 RepID=UPI0033A3B100